MSTLRASTDTVMKLLHKIPDLGEDAAKHTWKMVTHTKKFTTDQKNRLVNALKNNKHIQRRKSMMTKSTRKTIRGGKSCRRKSHRRKSHRRKSHSRKTRRR